MGGQSIPAFDYYMAPGVAKTMITELVKVIDTRYDDIDIDALKSANNYCNIALSSLQTNEQLDLVSIDIKNIWLALGDITGNSDNEKIIDDIFTKFCVGK